MKAQKLRGREGRNSAKVLSIATLFILLIIQPLKADTIWTEGYHEINDGDIYAEIYMYNDSTADMFGGDVYKLESLDIGVFNMYDGEMDLLFVYDSSTANILGGNLGALRATEDALVNLYAYDVTYHPTGGHYDRGWIEGLYIDSDLYFNFDFVLLESFSHINIIPEPSTFFLFFLGALMLRKRN